jgi:hypothetical protein
MKTWNALAGPEPVSRDNVTFAVDVTPDRKFAAIAVFIPGDVGNLAIVDHRPEVDWVVDRLVQLKALYNPLAIGIDGKGPAGSLLLDLEKAGICPPDGEPRRGDLAVTNASDMAAACGQLVDAVRKGVIRHQGQPMLNLAVAGSKTRPLGDAYAWARRTATQDISPLVAATLARWAHEARAEILSDYDVLQSVW